MQYLVGSYGGHQNISFFDFLAVDRLDNSLYIYEFKSIDLHSIKYRFDNFCFNIICTRFNTTGPVMVHWTMRAAAGMVWLQRGPLGSTLTLVTLPGTTICTSLLLTSKSWQLGGEFEGVRPSLLSRWDNQFLKLGRDPAHCWAWWYERCLCGG